MIAWNYPFGDVVMIRNQVAAQQAVAQATVATGLDLSKANFNYLIFRQKHSATPAWCPLRAFDDGQKTYIQFPPKVAVTEAPPLFVMGRNGDAQLVNYRVKGDWYIVDRLFDKAELRLGQAPQTVVAIVRADAKD
jgi:type IV secretion system protein VirB9